MRSLLMLAWIVVGAAVATKDPPTLLYHNQSSQSRPLETFVIDLDLPPQQRWTKVVTRYKTKIQAIYKFIEEFLQKQGELQTILEVADFVEHHGLYPHAAELRGEMEGIADDLKVDVGLVLALNLFYELVTACTSVVAEASGDSIWHGRNLDFNIPHLQGIALNVEFVRGGNVLYQGTTYATYIGIPTGMKAGAFSISQNQRFTRGKPWENLLEWIVRGGKGYSLYFRHVLEHAADYNQALIMLQTVKLIAPCYIIIAGTSKGQGAVITRARDSTVDTWHIGDNNAVADWFLVQTNDDHWKPPLDDRRNATNTHLQQYYSPATINATTMYRVMTMYPTMDELTTYTAVIHPKSGYYHAVAQNADLLPAIY